MLKFARWFFWRVFYTFRLRPKTFEGYMLRAIRRRWPWRKFRPSVWHNDDGKEWQIYFADERAFTERRTISVDCHIGMDSGTIVGFDVYDEILKRAIPSNAMLKELAKRNPPPQEYFEED